MPFDLELPDGTILEGVPDGTTKAQIAAKIGVPKGPNGNASLQTQFEAKKDASIGRTLLDQSLQGATFGTADEITDALGRGIAKTYAAISPTLDVADVPSYDDARAATSARLANEMETRPALSIGSNIAGALLTGGAGASTKAGSALANSLRAGGTGARILKGALAGAASGGLYGFNSGEGNFSKRLDSATVGAEYGGAFGAAAPAIGAAVRGGANAVIPKIDPETAKLAQAAIDAGIPLSVDQIAPSAFRNTVQKVSQEIPFSGTEKFRGKQRQAVQDIAAKSIGQESDNLGPETIKQFKKDTAVKFKEALGTEPISFDDVSLSRFDDIVTEAKRLSGSDTYNIVRDNIGRLKNDIGSVVNPEKLADVRSRLIADAAKAEGKSKTYLTEAINVIDDITEKQLPEESRALLQQVRREYRNFKTIQPLLKKSTDGKINPVELQSRVASSKYIPSETIATGEDALVDAARASKQFLPVKLGSDTTQKTALLAVLAGKVGSVASLGSLGAFNALFQKAYNQNPATVRRVINKALSKGKISPDDIKGLPADQGIEVLNTVKNMLPKNQADELQALFEGKKRTEATIRGYGKK